VNDYIRRTFRVRRLFCLTTFLCLLPVAANALNSQELNRVTFLNETGRSIVRLFTSAKDSRVWGPDLLGGKRLKYGAFSSFYVQYRGDHAAFDLLAFDDHNDAYLISGFEVVEEHANVVEFSVHHILKQAPKLELVQLYLTNVTNRLVSYLFFAPEESSHWGFELLDDSTSLESGASLVFSVPVGKKEHGFEILAIGKDQTIIQRRVSLSAPKGDVFLDLTLSDLR